MFVSLFGLLTIQGLWIKYAIETEQAKFDQLVYDAMHTALAKVEQQNVYEFIDQEIELPEPEANVSINFKELEDLEESLEKLKEVKEFEDINSMLDEQLSFTYQYFDDTIITFNKDFLSDTIYSNSNVYIRTPNFNRTDDKITIVGSHNIDEHEPIEGPQFYVHNDEGEFTTWALKADSLKRVIHIHQNKLLEEKEKVVKHKIEAFNENIEKWVVEYRFENDLDFITDKLKDYEDAISDALSNNGIWLGFDYQVIKEDDTVTSIFSSVGNDKILSDQYKTEVFPKEIFAKGLFLLLNFPEKNSHIYSKVYLLVLGSLIFTLIILVTFGSTLYYIQKQKKLSEVKSDFINNMTHEFKTPIATIRLASDAMESPKVLGIEKPTRYYLNIIRQENKRMNNQVERVLQMALIDQGQLQVDIQRNDVHSIIQNCINVLELIAQKKQGKVSSSLRATCFNIDIDEIHFANVINNLLDNAIKYTTNPPDILIETYNKQDNLFVRISDNGFGMTKEVVKHIFDKFYRKPTGNIHNIKGFGLGLSYVKAVIEAHGGDISVSSEPGNGSTFLLKFNCIKNNTEA